MRNDHRSRKEATMRLSKVASVFAALFFALLLPALASATTSAKKADLSITLKDQPDPVVYLWNITYKATVTNLGPDAAVAVEITDYLHSDLHFVSGAVSQGTWNYDGGFMDCQVGTIPSGGTVTMTVVAEVQKMNKVPNTVDVSSSTTDPVSKNNEATEWTVIVEGPPPPTPEPTPSGGVDTGGGGSANLPSRAGAMTLALLAMAALGTVAFRFAKR
jgi:uncharacterized repeat protein (TIGR01451 family)